MTSRIARFVSGIRVEDLDPGVVDTAIALFTDTLGVGWAGTDAPGIPGARALALSQGGRAESRVRERRRPPAPEAAFVNAAAAAATRPATPSIRGPSSRRRDGDAGGAGAGGARAVAWLRIPRRIHRRHRDRAPAVDRDAAPQRLVQFVGARRVRRRGGGRPPARARRAAHHARARHRAVVGGRDEAGDRRTDADQAAADSVRVPRRAAGGAARRSRRHRSRRLARRTVRLDALV
ncbi:MAG: MmgE/PrpD family protein [Betaproteobacteria bacterium]|nr:MmgE/PrpD family protein [Betaproteobacteria bacterium]